MSYMVARMQKMKVGNLGGAHKHNERIFEKHSNKDIDTSRSHLNYELTDRDRSVSYERQIKDYVNEKTLFCVMNGLLRQIKIFLKSWARSRRENFLKRLKTTSRRITEKPTLLMPVYILMRVPHTCT